MNNVWRWVLILIYLEGTRQNSLLFSSGMSFTIHSISTLSTTNHWTKITIAFQPIKMQYSSKCRQVKVAGTDTILRHKAIHRAAVTQATNCSPATAKTKGYLRHWFKVQTLTLLSHRVIALQVDHPIIGSAAHKRFHRFMEFRAQMRRTHQVQNTGER